MKPQPPTHANLLSIPLLDPLLDADRKRYCLYPVKYQRLFHSYKEAVSCFWTVEEVDLSQDRAQFEKLTLAEQRFVELTLGFFASSDGIVMENLGTNFATEIVIPEARHFYAIQAGMEAIHGEMYALLIDTIILSAEKKEQLFASIRTHPATARKASWALAWMAPERDIRERLLAFACVEGIHFSSSFACLFWLKKKGIMPGLTFSNELISRDEGLHRDFALELLKTFQVPLDPAVILEIVGSAVEVEWSFVDSLLEIPLLGMNAELMKSYVSFVADHLLCTLGIGKVYKKENPFEWMELISMQGKTNFFERRVSEYQKATVLAKSAEDPYGCGTTVAF
jgi:ribonucleoside-diphosphate reductase subunit M2